MAQLRQTRAAEVHGFSRGPERVTLDEAILLDLIDPDRAHVLAYELAVALASEYDGSEDAAETMNRLLGDSGREQRRRRSEEVWDAWCVDPEWALATLEEPWPCRLSTQELVDLLKMPTCLGEVRRVVLDYLGRLHGRRFVSHWGFVRYAEEQRLAVDLTSPPRRAEPVRVAP